MALLTIQQAGGAGLAPTYTAANTTDTFVGDGRTMLHVKNGGGGSITATISSHAVPGVGEQTLDKVITIPAAGERMIGGILPGAYTDNTGIATVTYSGVTTVTAAAIQVV